MFFSLFLGDRTTDTFCLFKKEIIGHTGDKVAHHGLRGLDVTICLSSIGHHIDPGGKSIGILTQVADIEEKELFIAVLDQWG